ncbi:polyphosphoinositide phosphatase-like [Pecten maximus]|uniref:polyphosphoinositide phosphatase-like n=1 Tax=Pecten maximus TaxID=6579 RepID=UPI00145885E5|nr:polyphosphoinositide phosphatase-like [Pecten maximus]
MECPIISRIQKVILYETKARFYVVGSNKTETCYRVLKVDRTEPKELVIQDDKAEYSMVQIRNLLTMIKHGNINKDSKLKAGDSPLAKSVSAFGIFGFVRFLEGYYIVLITKRRKAAVLGPHVIYKIEDTAMIYIPNDNIRSSSYSYSEEQRYLKMFQSIDLSSNFYFSYSYDLTHTLQYNMTTAIDPVTLGQPECTESTPPLKVWEQSESESRQKTAEEQKVDSDMGQSAETNKKEEVIYGVRSVPEEKYVWNHFLQRNCKDIIHRDWLILVTHGFVDQRNICVYGKPLYLTLIARRSNQFAGTRFLKRGANCKGDVANEVETEQILHDASITFLERANITSFVQMRGSVPLYWSQDVSKMVPKPPIMIDQIDPYAGVAGRHFNEVLKRYGAPVIILNLVKKKEKKRHESILTDEYKKAVNYLNQFLPPEHALKYISFDMAHISKNKDVLQRMVSFAGKCVKLCGLFVHKSKKVGEEFWQSNSLRGLRGVKTEYGSKQTGVARTNCVDCLDRTNTAQFALGKYALAYQLYILGILKEPKLEFDTVCTKMLEQLYEDQGDTIALQYGGSQLVHRIEGYRKTAPWTAHSKDIMNTISRYYSNTFADLEKQQATNVFLGVFEPVEGKPNIWELPTDFYLHNKDFGAKLTQIRRSYSQWWEVPVYRSLPLPWKQVSKPQTSEVVCVDQVEEKVNLFEEYYRTTELTFFQDIFTHSLYPTFSKDVKPRTAKVESPFTRRVQPERENTVQEVNPNISGKDSTSSTTSTGSESSESSSDEVELLYIDISSSQSDSSADCEGSQNLHKKKDLETKSDYGIDLGEPRTYDMNKYKRYVNLGRACLGNADLLDTRYWTRDWTHRCNRVMDIGVASVFKLGSSYEVEPPPVNKQDQLLYHKYVMCGENGATNPSKDQIRFYKRYISKNMK